MEKPEYKLKNVAVTTGEFHSQLNNLHREGYDFVADALNHVVYKKRKIKDKG